MALREKEDKPLVLFWDKFQHYHWSNSLSKPYAFSTIRPRERLPEHALDYNFAVNTYFRPRPCNKWAAYYRRAKNRN